MARKVTLAELIRAGLVAPNVGAVPSDPYATAREGYAMATEPIPAAQPALDWLGNVPVVGSALRFGGDMMAPSYADLLTAGMSRVGRVLSGGGDTLADLARLTGYHGTPHTFPPSPNNPLGEFDASKIGTGEGGQKYGYGIYIAENPEVARKYAMQVPYGAFQKKVAQVYGEFDSPNDAMAALKSAGLSEQELRVVKALEKDDWLGFDYPHQALRAALKEPQSFDLSKETEEALKNLSVLYKADVPDEMIAKMLDWDAPLSAQPSAIQAAAKKLLAPLGQDVSSNVFAQSGGALETALRNAYGKQQAAELLRQAGVPGIKYLDAGSRGATTAPTRNFVVFPGEERNVKLLSRD